ncbi:MAG: CsgG/HfaB family protein [Enterobacteriaceae bacterium]|nr:CsgG/HfaB family protein [Enterobacteriaceae bacterium]
MFLKEDILNIIKWFFLLCVIFFSCKTVPIKNTKSNNSFDDFQKDNAVISNNFNFNKHKRIAVLPFKKTEGLDKGYDYIVIDKIAMHCMELGFTVVDREQLEQIFNELKLELTGLLSQDNLNRIGKILNIDALVFGTIAYVNGDFMDSESMRFVDVTTGEVLISCYVQRKEDDTSLSSRMFQLLKSKLDELKTTK